MSAVFPPARGSRTGVRTLPKLGTFAVLCLLATSATAQYIEPIGRGRTGEVPVQPNEGIFLGPVLFSPSVQLTSMFDDNVYKVDEGYDPDGVGPIPVEEPSGDFLYIAQARMAFKVPFSHSYVALSWLPQYRAYADTPTVRKSSHALNFDSVLNFSSGARLSVRDTWSSGFYESRRFTEEYELTLSSTPFRRNDAALEYEHFLTPRAGLVGMLVRNDFSAEPTDVSGLRVAVGGTDIDRGRYFDYFDYTTDAVELRGFLDRSRFRIYGSAAFANTDQDRRNVKRSQLEANGCMDDGSSGGGGTDAVCDLIRDQVDFETIRQLEGLVGVQGEVLRATRADVKVGYANWQFLEGDLDPYRGPSFRGNVVHLFNDRSSATFDFERVPVQTTGQYRGYYVRKGLALSFDRIFTPTLQGRIRLSYHASEFPGSNEPPPPNASESLRESLEAFTVKDIDPVIEVVYRPRRGFGYGPIMARLGYNPFISRSDLPGLDIDSHRFTFALQYGWF